MSILLLVTRNARDSLYSCTTAAILFSVAWIGELARGCILKARTRYLIAAAHGDRRVSTGVR